MPASVGTATPLAYRRNPIRRVSSGSSASDRPVCQPATASVARIAYTAQSCPTASDTDPSPRRLPRRPDRTRSLESLISSMFVGEPCTVPSSIAASGKGGGAAVSERTSIGCAGLRRARDKTDIEPHLNWNLVASPPHENTQTEHCHGKAAQTACGKQGDGFDRMIDHHYDRH